MEDKGYVVFYGKDYSIPLFLEAVNKAEKDEELKEEISELKDRYILVYLGERASDPYKEAKSIIRKTWNVLSESGKNPDTKSKEDLLEGIVAALGCLSRCID